MKLTIVPSDLAVYEDGLCYAGLDLSQCGIPANVHALQWFGSSGWIEFTDGPNQDISELPAWASACTTVWEAADYAAKHPPEPPAPTPEQIIAANKSRAESLLLESDWSMLPDVPLANKTEWESYRTALRAIAITPTVDPVWPTKPASVWA